CGAVLATTEISIKQGKSNFDNSKGD
ncbi:hypothetical protein MGSAQ_000189, partial [marine sediment metagenome]